MTLQINIAEAKARLSELVSRAEAGEDIVLARSGKPVMRLQPLKPRRKPDKPKIIGALAHLGPVSDEFLDMWLGPDPAFDPDKKDLF